MYLGKIQWYLSKYRGKKGGILGKLGVTVVVSVVVVVVEFGWLGFT